MSGEAAGGADGRSFRTSLGTSDADSITLMGMDLADEVMGEVGFGELALWLVFRRRPEPGQVRVFEAVLASLADHGFVPTALAARLTYVSAPDSLQGAMAAGILGGGSRYLGVTEDCGQFLAEVVDGLDELPTDEAGWDDVARDVVRESREAKRIIPGLGHPTHTSDPRVPRLFRIAREEDLFGPCLSLFEAIGRVHEEFIGRRLPLNGAGVGGAALVDAGFPRQFLRGAALLARCAGVLGQLVEEAEHPVGNEMYLELHERTEYVDPRTTD